MYGVPLGSKVCIFGGTKNDISGTKITKKIQVVLPGY